MAFRFRKFEVYGDIKRFVRTIYKLTGNFPKEEVYGLVSQLRRASVSIALNLAEGSDRGSDRDFKRFLQMSIGSINEVVAALDLSLDNQILDKDQHYLLLADAESIVRRLSQLSTVLADAKSFPNAVSRKPLAVSSQVCVAH